MRDPRPPRGARRRRARARRRRPPAPSSCSPPSSPRRPAVVDRRPRRGDLGRRAAGVGHAAACRATCPACAGGSAASTALVWDDPGYRLDVDRDQVDARRFEDLADEGAARCGPASRRRTGGPPGCRTGAVAGAGPRRVPRPRRCRGLAAGSRSAAWPPLEDRLDADLALGRHAPSSASWPSWSPPTRCGRGCGPSWRWPCTGRVARPRPCGPWPTPATLRGGARHRARPPAARTSRRRSSPTTRRSTSPIRPVPRRSPRRRAGAGPAAGPALVGRGDELARPRRRPRRAARTTPASSSSRASPASARPAWPTSCGAGSRAGRGGRRRGAGATRAAPAPALWPWLAPLRAIAAEAPVASRPASPTSARPARCPTCRRRPARCPVRAVRGRRRPAGPRGGNAARWSSCSTTCSGPTTRRSSCSRFLAGDLGAAACCVVGTMRQLEVGRNDAVTDALAAVARRPGSRRLQLRGPRRRRHRRAARRRRRTSGGAAGRGRDHPRPGRGQPVLRHRAGPPARRGGRRGGEVPASVGDVVRRRLARLPAGHRRAARASPPWSAATSTSACWPGRRPSARPTSSTTSSRRSSTGCWSRCPAPPARPPLQPRPRARGAARRHDVAAPGPAAPEGGRRHRGRRGRRRRRRDPGRAPVAGRRWGSAIGRPKRCASGRGRPPPCRLRGRRGPARAGRLAVPHSGRGARPAGRRARRAGRLVLGPAGDARPRRGDGRRRGRTGRASWPGRRGGPMSAPACCGRSGSASTRRATPSDPGSWPPSSRPRRSVRATA